MPVHDAPWPGTRTATISLASSLRRSTSSTKPLSLFSSRAVDEHRIGRPSTGRCAARRTARPPRACCSRRRNPGSPVRPRRSSRPFSNRRRARVWRKKAFISQNWFCFQSLNGWLWHCVHWTCRPRKTCDVLAVACTRVLLQVAGQEIDEAVEALFARLAHALGRHQLVDQPVVGHVALKARAQRLLQPLAVDQRAALSPAAAADQQVGPQRGPVAGVFLDVLIAQQAVDQPRFALRWPARR